MRHTVPGLTIGVESVGAGVRMIETDPFGSTLRAIQSSRPGSRGEVRGPALVGAACCSECAAAARVGGCGCGPSIGASGDSRMTNTEIALLLGVAAVFFIGIGTAKKR